MIIIDDREDIEDVSRLRPLFHDVDDVIAAEARHDFPFGPEVARTQGCHRTEMERRRRRDCFSVTATDERLTDLTLRSRAALKSARAGEISAHSAFNRRIFAKR